MLCRSDGRSVQHAACADVFVYVGPMDAFTASDQRADYSYNCGMPGREIESTRINHLDWLESEAIHIMREVAAECSNPALLFSGGKDSIVLLRLAEKAFRPGRFPFPLLHIDTGHNFPEVIIALLSTTQTDDFETIRHPSIKKEIV
jgi:hypothetical protein